MAQQNSPFDFEVLGAKIKTGTRHVVWRYLFLVTVLGFWAFIAWKCSAWFALLPAIIGIPKQIASFIAGLHKATKP